MAAMHHPRIALFLGAYLPPKDGNLPIHILMELCSGDMETLIYRDRKRKKLSLFQRMEWGKQAAEGLAWLHGAGVVHRDVKPTNMLYHAPSRSVKIADFGLAGLLGKGEQLADGKVVGNPRYWAPEQIERKPFQRATDVYGWAISMYQFIARKDPFPEYWGATGMSPFFLEAVLDMKIRPELPKDRFKCPNTLKRMIEQAWHHEPSQRPTFPEIINLMEQEVLLNCAIPDHNGANVWGHLCDLSKAVGLQREIKWEDVAPRLSPAAVHEAHFDQASHNLADYAFYKLFRDGFDPFGDEVTSIERFGQTLGYFPVPFQLHDNTEFRKSVLSYVRHSWFWGYSSRFEAEMVASASPVGSFLVRLAVNSDYRLTMQTEQGPLHLGVKHEYQGHTYEVKVPTTGPPIFQEALAPVAGTTFTSLPDLALAVGQALGITAVPVSKSPFL